MGWSRALTKYFTYFVDWSSHHPLPRNCPLCAIAIALVALAIARILTRQTCCHCHCPLCCHRRCLPANLVTISIALPPSPSSSLATLIAATVVTAAIALVVACLAPSSPSPLLLPPSSLPSSLLATLVAVVIALFVASAFTCLPPALPSCQLGWGRGGPYRSSARSYFGRHRQCRHHRHRLCRPRNRPGGAGPTTRGIPMPGRQLAPTWWGCCPCSRHHPPCRPAAVAAVAAAAACQW
jgi:hypothetical protein